MHRASEVDSVTDQAQALSLVSADARVVGVASQLANKHHTLTLNVKVSA